MILTPFTLWHHQDLSIHMFHSDGFHVDMLKMVGELYMSSETQRTWQSPCFTTLKAAGNSSTARVFSSTTASTACCPLHQVRVLSFIACSCDENNIYWTLFFWPFPDQPYGGWFTFEKDFMEQSGVDIYFVLFENLKRVRHSYKLHAHESFSMNYVVIKLIKTPVKVHTFLKKNVNLKSKKKTFLEDQIHIINKQSSQ